MGKENSFRELASRLRGPLLLPGDDGYESARKVFNAMIDNRPAAIARCACTQDVVEAVRFARQHDLQVSVRGGGHNVAGKAVCDDGLMIDLAPMKAIQVDAAKRLARAQPGLTLGECDRETQAFRLAAPLGVVSQTGIAGLTLGGGYGWLSGKYGLACDNLVSAEVVMADGRVLTASEKENPDLFWALRGAGANFGIVTRFDYRLQPVETLFAGLVLYPVEKAREVLTFYEEFSRTGPDELTVAAALVPAPDGSSVVGFALAYCGSPAEDERLRQRFHQPGAPVADLARRMSYVEAQSMLDAGYPPGQYHYWKAAFLSGIRAEAIATMADFFARRPSPLSCIFLEHWHGAAMRVAPTATAFAHRGERYNFSILGIWRAPGEAEANLAWTRDFWDSMRPHTVARTYVNYLSEGEGDRVREAYGPNYDRLVELKKKYDPDNFFRVNQNIAPATAAAS